MAVVVVHAGLGGQGREQGGQDRLVRLRVHIERAGVQHHPHLGVLLLPAQGQGHRAGVRIVHQQRGDDPHPIGGIGFAGVKAGERDLQTVAVKEFRVNLPVQNGLGHALAVAAAADDHAPARIPHAGGQQLGGAGAALVDEHHHRLAGDGLRGAVLRAHAPLPVLKIQVTPRPVQGAQHLHGGVGIAPRVAPQVDDPALHLAVVLLQPRFKLLAGVHAEAGADDIPRSVLQHLEPGGGDDQGPADDGVRRAHPIPQHRHVHLAALLAQQQLLIALAGGDAGGPADLHNQIPRPQLRVLRPAAGEHLFHQNALLGVLNGHADARRAHHFPLQAAQKRLVCLLTHVLRVRVQRAQQSVQAVRLIGPLRQLLVIVDFQQLNGLLHRQRAGRSDEQDQGQQRRGQTDDIFFHDSSPLPIRWVL